MKTSAGTTFRRHDGPQKSTDKKSYVLLCRLVVALEGRFICLHELSALAFMLGPRTYEEILDTAFIPNDFASTHAGSMASRRGMLLVAAYCNTNYDFEHPRTIR
jgi:hypothetical protein